jgi:adenosine deaminase
MQFSGVVHSTVENSRKLHDHRGRDVRALPKAHLHLHFTGSLRPATLRELADRHGVRLPDALLGLKPPELTATDERGWFRFQRLYDIARSVIRTPEDVRRLLREAAEDERADGSGWLEIQVDPTTYAKWLGGLTPTVELIIDAAREASELTDVGVAVVIAANRTLHPMEARVLARLAARYLGRGVVGFGLSNDERRGPAREFERAFAIARQAGLPAVPHGGELAGARSVRECLQDLRATRIGHGVRSVEEPDLVRELARAGVVLEVCPASNVALGVVSKPADVPLPALREAGVAVALGADDPLLFGSRLADQYELVREAHGCSDEELAELARCSIHGSFAPPGVKSRLLDGVAAWLRSQPGS